MAQGQAELVLSEGRQTAQSRCEDRDEQEKAPSHPINRITTKNGLFWRPLSNARRDKAAQLP
jgi:hypothetical protein